MNLITEDERARIQRATELSAASWNKAGYYSDAVGTRFTDEDYRDCWHRVGAGGKKMAALVARAVSAINKEMGYQ